MPHRTLNEEYLKNRTPPRRSIQAEDYKTYVLYSLLGLGAATGLTILGVKLVQKTRTKSAERDSMDFGSAASFAKRLKMAFDNDG